MKGADPLAPVVEAEMAGLHGFRFTCAVCARRSGLFSLKDSAETQSRQHVEHRCPGVANTAPPV